MSIEDKNFNQLVQLDILAYEPVTIGDLHECVICGRMAGWRLSDEASGVMDAERPYLYICDECHKDALAIPRVKRYD
jgi:hypothetical protein